MSDLVPEDVNTSSLTDADSETSAMQASPTNSEILA